MSKNSTDKKRLSKVQGTSKTFKIFAVSFHGTNLEVMEQELVRQMEVCSRKKIYAVMVNGTDSAATDGDQTFSEEATELGHQAHQIEEGIQRCKKDFESAVWESLTRTLSEDLRRYWNEKGEEVGGNSEIKEAETIIPKKIKEVDLKILNSQVKDAEKCEYFIVLFGKFSTDVLIKLLRSSQPLQAIIHFIPCPQSDLEVNFPKLHKDIDFLRKSPDTKNVGIFIETLIQVPPRVAIGNFTPEPPSPTASEYLLEQEEQQKYSQKIYDQFTWYLYDIEMLTQQFIVYQTDFVEINDAELPSQEELLWSKFVQVVDVDGDGDVDTDSNKDNSIDDDSATPAVVGVFLDNLFSAIENRANLEQKNSLCHLSPFLENNYGKIIVEDGNELLRSAVVANQLNVVTYWKLVDMIINNAFESNLVRGADIDIDIELPGFYELLSWESCVQKLETYKQLYDTTLHVALSEDCKLFIFRKYFNQVVEIRNKYQLPTRLCFRDFCESIAPDLANILRKYEVHQSENNLWQDFNKNKMFSGLVWDDTLKELCFCQNVFRFEDGLISCSVENWSNDDQMISIAMQLFNTFVYLYPCKELDSNYSRIRLLMKENISCDIEVFKDLLYPNIIIHLNTGCQVRYIHGDNFKAIEQCYHSKNHSELKRFYTCEGFVIRYLRNEKIEVLTPNGIIYLLCSADIIEDDLSKRDLHFEISSTDQELKEISDQIDFVRNLEKYGIYCESFEVTLADGRKLKMDMNGNILEEISIFLIYEWTDYCEGKRFLDRDDGLKMVWDIDSLKCYYPCGTVLTTTVVESYIKTNFECETNIMENLFGNTNPSFVAKGANKARRQDSYVTYNLNYLMQHKNYATVEVCGRDKMEIFVQSPDADELKLILREEDDDNHSTTITVVVAVLLIDIGEELSFRIAAGVCTILSGISNPQNKQIKIELNLFPNHGDILSFKNEDTFLKVNANGEMTLENVNFDHPPYEEALYLLAKENSFGIEFVSNKIYKNLISNYKDAKYFFNSSTQTVLLKPILPSVVFPVSNSQETDKDLKHFQPVICQDHRMKLKQPERVFTARVINKHKNLSLMNILTFVENINFNESTLSNQLNAALSYFWDEKTKPSNSKWKIKLTTLQKDLLYKMQLKQNYNFMLKHNIFPNYYDFKNIKFDVKLINVDKLIQISNFIKK